MKKRKIRKIIISSFTFFSFMGTSLFLLSPNFTFNNVSARTIPTMVENTSSTEVPTKANVFPFYVVGGRRAATGQAIGNVTASGYVTIRDVHSTDMITYTVSRINNREGTLTISASGLRNSAGDMLAQPWIRSVNLTGFKTTLGPTSLDFNNNDISNTYATNVVITDDPSSDVDVLVSSITTLRNGMSDTYAIGGWPRTTSVVTSLEPNNRDGSLNILYTLTNYFDNNGAYIINSPINDTIRIPNGFRIVPGPTELNLTIDNRNILPSNFSNTLNIGNYQQYFRIVNGLASTQIEDISVLDADDNNGTVRIRFSILGGYYDSNYVERTASSTSLYQLEQTFSGFLGSGPIVDVVGISVGATVGSIALIAIVAITYFFVIKSKKSSVEKARKQKIANKSSTPKVGSTNNLTSSSMSKGPISGGATINPSNTQQQKPPMTPPNTPPKSPSLGSVSRPTPPPIKK